MRLQTLRGSPLGCPGCCCVLISKQQCEAQPFTGKDDHEAVHSVAGYGNGNSVIVSRPGAARLYMRWAVRVSTLRDGMIPLDTKPVLPVQNLPGRAPGLRPSLTGPCCSFGAPLRILTVDPFSPLLPDLRSSSS